MNSVYFAVLYFQDAKTGTQNERKKAAGTSRKEMLAAFLNGYFLNSYIWIFTSAINHDCTN